MQIMPLKRKNILSFVLLLLAIILLVIIINNLVTFRVDLTGDKRYTVSAQSKQVIKNLDDVVFIRIYLDGEMPVQMKKFRTSVKEKIDELKRYSSKNIQYEFRNPSEGDEERRTNLYIELRQKGLEPLTIYESDIEGGATQRVLFPGALVNYKGKELSVNFVQNNQVLSSEENLNFALQNLEYELVNVIQKISRVSEDKIAFIEGHGELNDYESADILTSLAEYYNVERVTIDGMPGILNEYKAVIIAKPQGRWSEADKFVMDQYIMQGGRTAWFIDAVQVFEDSLTVSERTFGIAANHNLDDQLFNYGVRINYNVLQDLQCAPITVNVAPAGMPSQFQLVPWTYFPLLFPPSDNPITKGLNVVKSQYPGVIDTVGNNPAIKKTYLLYSSDKAKVTATPVLVSLSQIDESVAEKNFNQSYLPVAALLEGEFVSPFRNRITANYTQGADFDVKVKSVPTKMVVVSDGDIIRNDVRRTGTRVTPMPLGYDRNTNITYGNKDFVKNIVNYLTDENGLMEVKNRTFKMRLLDASKVAENHTQIIILNTLVPVVFVVICGILFIWYRRRKYTHF